MFSEENFSNNNSPCNCDIDCPCLASDGAMMHGENGALAHVSTGTAVLDLSFALVRDVDDAKVEKLVRAVLAERDPKSLADLFVLTFATRDCRGGKGERSLFRKLFSILYSVFPTTACELVPLISEYGYWKDIFSFLTSYKRLPMLD